jgi:prepilin-type N-terminal cleavage/methylation domain-containing protein
MSRFAPPRCGHSRRAFTLIEMLVAMVLTLIMIAAIAEFYAYVGDTVRDGRAMIEMSGQLRSAVQRLKSDFDQITSPVVPWADDGAAAGYFEYHEGRIILNGTKLNAFMATDYDANASDVVDAIEDSDSNGQNDIKELGVTDLVGDMDDYLAFTIRSNGDPFSGRWLNPATGLTEVKYSQLAEVVWFTAFKNLNPAANNTWDFNEPRYIVRRLLLIRPDLSLGTVANPFVNNDISAHQTAGGWQANTLADLGRRENRFAHTPFGTPANFPNSLLINPFDVTTFQNFVLSGDYEGEDVILSNVLAFDVRIYDREAVLRQDSAASATPTNALAPPDVGYLQAVIDAHPVLGTGAYVDLGYGMKLYDQLVKQKHSNADLYIFGNPAPTPPIPSRLGNSMQYYAQQPVAGPGIAVGNPLNTYLTRMGYTYDTWSLSYERDGINQDGDIVGGQPLIDEGTNGLDDPDSSGSYANGVDDFNERETRPPYSQAPRGLQVKIRLYEPSSRQVRQATVTVDFLTE